MKKPKCLNLEHYNDDRGYLVPLTNVLKDELDKTIKRVYILGDFGKNIIRGFHYHKKEIKIFYIAHGSAKFVAINPEKPDEDRYIFATSNRYPNLVIIPPGYANGWMSLEDNTILVALSTSTYEESIKDDVRYNPYKWGDVWSVKGR